MPSSEEELKQLAQEARYTATIVDFDRIQAEQVAWSTKNFGVGPQHRPLLGIIEELCELDCAMSNEDEVETLDAVGDVTIYMLDYCGKRGWRMQEIWHAREPLNDVVDELANDSVYDIVPHVGALAHAQLKGEQNIRGGSEKHDVALRKTLGAVLWMLVCISNDMGKEYLDIVNDVWAKVSKRDWTKNPDTAHEVAEAT